MAQVLVLFPPSSKQFKRKIKLSSLEDNWRKVESDLKKAMSNINSKRIESEIPFKDVPVKKFFYLEPSQKTPICFKLDENRYSCSGITYFCSAERIVYLASPQ
ncbi:hypothetical protein HC931_25530 [Candidatus Gracilibacteria bacterium]|nr:hypothetical protein [Candidatus Gracilibacteria bacterium]NJM90440.1 hypothetical protein [Hydrococcus sp. RU_2_2]NJP21868.1 hypothetical protein [Hydrococcus sp. CRU_1_1]NJQ97660.1 hypothetical protein [Hydrococcus sp. CSU_1_8]